MNDIYNLERFINAQEHSYQIALKEIENGKKCNHWMWFIFPQIPGLGLSSISKEYSIKNSQEAKDYLNHNTSSDYEYDLCNDIEESCSSSWSWWSIIMFVIFILLVITSKPPKHCEDLFTTKM